MMITEKLNLAWRECQAKLQSAINEDAAILAIHAWEEEVVSCGLGVVNKSEYGYILSNGQVFTDPSRTPTTIHVNAADIPEKPRHVFTVAGELPPSEAEVDFIATKMSEAAPTLEAPAVKIGSGIRRQLVGVMIFTSEKEFIDWQLKEPREIFEITPTIAHSSANEVHVRIFVTYNAGIIDT